MENLSPQMSEISLDYSFFSALCFGVTLSDPLQIKSAPRNILSQANKLLVTLKEISKPS